MSKQTSKDWFEELYRDPDPWKFFTSDYEQRKYERQIAVLKRHRPDPENILEIGCAEGAFTKLLAEHFPKARITAIDLSSAALNRAIENLKSYGDRVELINDDIVEYVKILPKNNFDSCVFSETIYYLVGQHSMLTTYKTLAKIVDTLRVDGILVMANVKQAGPVKVVMESTRTMLLSLGKMISNSSYRDSKRENRFLRYEISVLRRNGPQPKSTRNTRLKFLKNIIYSRR